MKTKWQSIKIADPDYKKAEEVATKLGYRNRTDFVTDTVRRLYERFLRENIQEGLKNAFSRLFPGDLWFSVPAAFVA